MEEKRNPTRPETDYPFALIYNMRRPIRMDERAVDSKIVGGREREQL